MKKDITILLVATLALAACSQIEPETQEGYTLTLYATKDTDGVATKALSLNGKTLNETWDGTEKVQVYKYSDGKETFIGTLTAAASATDKTVLTGKMSIAPDPEKDGLNFYYLAPDWDYRGQDGTLSTISRRYDFCDVESLEFGRYYVGGKNIYIDELETIKFRRNSQAIVKFVLTDMSSSEAIHPTRLTISGEKLYQYLGFINPASSFGDLTIGPLPGNTNEIFAALRLSGTSNLTLVAETAGGDTYRYEKAGASLENGQYYEITVEMTKVQ